MPPGTPAPAPGSLKTWLVAAALTLLVCAGFVAAQTTRPAASGVHGDIQRLVEMADGARQTGQPGNDKIDAWVQERFESAVRRNNDPAKWETAQQLVAEADKADAEFTRARMETKVSDSAAVDAQTPTALRVAKFVLDTPYPWMWTCFFIAALMMIAAKLQRRKGPFVGGIVFVGLGAAILVASMTVNLTTAPTDGAAAGPVGADRVNQVALAAYEADVRAANSLKGLWQSGRIEYPTAVFVPGEAWMTAAGQRIRIYALAPNLIEPGNLPEAGFKGPLVYVGKGRPEDLRGKKLDGAVAVLEFNSDKRWIGTLPLGAKAILIVEPADASEALAAQAALKTTDSPISVPRFYVRRAELAEALGQDWPNAGANQVTLEQKPSRWERRVVATDWLFIPGAADPASDTARELVHVQAYKDAASIVPELSPGATGAANLVTMMRMLEQWERTPPRRPVLLTAVNEHANALLGEQETAHALFAPVWNKGAAGLALTELNTLENWLAIDRFVGEIYGQSPSPELTEQMRGKISDVAGQKIELKKAIVDHLTQTNNAQREERRRLIMWLDRHRLAKAAGEPGELSVEEEARLRARVDTIDAESSRMLQLMKVFNRFGKQVRPDDLEPDERKLLEETFALIARQRRASAADLTETRDRLLSNLAIRRRLLALQPAPEAPPADADQAIAERYRPLPATALIALDLSFGNDRVGFMNVGWFNDANAERVNEATDRMVRFIKYTVDIAEGLAERGGPALFEDTLRMNLGMAWQAHVGGKFAFGSEPALPYQVPALTLLTVRDMRAHGYTPFDTPEQLDPERVERVVNYTRDYLAALLDAPELDLVRKRNVGVLDPMTVELQVRKLDEFTIGAPETPLPNALVIVTASSTAMAASRLPTQGSMYGEVRPWVTLIADSGGRAMVRGAMWHGGGPLAFAYDPDFRKVRFASDLGEGERRFTSVFSSDRNTHYVPKLSVASEFSKVDLIGLTQPLNLTPTGTVGLIDASQDAPPMKFSAIGALPEGSTRWVPLSRDPTGSVFLEPGSFVKFRIGSGLAINWSESAPKGRGFSVETPVLPDLVRQSAADMQALTRQRLEMLERKGVTNEAARRYNEEAAVLLKAADAAAAAGRSDEATVLAEQSRGKGLRAYLRARGTIDDLTKAVVIFLALVIPFCFFLTKLISPWADVNRNLTLFAVVFVIMAVLLRFVHPAFAVAETPEVVILAFIILGLAGFVGMVLIGRFNSNMTQAVEESQLAESVEAAQSRLAGVAFLVGVNNMKRRRIRTTLTALTIVLVTFTMLSVISVGQDTEPATVRVAQASPYNGFFFARSGLAAIDTTQLQRLRAHFERDGQTLARAWAQRLGQYGEYLPYELTPHEPVPGAAAATLHAKVLVGVEKAEDGFLQEMPLAAGRWISDNDASEAVLSVATAKLLGITPENFAGKRFGLGGREVELVGLLDDEKLAAIRDLNDVPLLPMLAAAAQTKQDESSKLQSAAEAAGTAALDAGGGLGAAGQTMARPEDVIFVPIGFARNLGDAEYRTLSVKYADQDAAQAARRAWAAANDLIQFQHALVTTGLTQPVPLGDTGRNIDPGQYTLASSTSTEVQGILKIAIPIILAATIILNTMLGSVMERRREVAIYNAIGLNPGHVMMFFLAESLVFGMIGSVAGYLVGQILSLVVVYFGLDLELNYSSLSVMVVIFLTIATVLLSTVYPAVMAARAAVPSGQRRWSLPHPEGDEIRVQFPFSYDAARVLGVCAYLRDFMRQNSEASTGKFLATLGPVGRVPSSAVATRSEDTAATKDVVGEIEGLATADHSKAYAMLFDIAPAPFDLGVNQKMEVYAYYDPRVKAHMLSVHLTRLSGEAGNWVAVNQPFLEALRKRLLGWRSQKPATHQSFFHEGEKLFAAAPDLPVQPSGDGARLTAQEHA